MSSTQTVIATSLSSQDRASIPTQNSSQSVANEKVVTAIPDSTQKESDDLTVLKIKLANGIPSKRPNEDGESTTTTCPLPKRARMSTDLETDDSEEDEGNTSSDEDDGAEHIAEKLALGALLQHKYSHLRSSSNKKHRGVALRLKNSLICRAHITNKDDSKVEINF